MSFDEVCTEEFWEMNESCWANILGEDYLYATAKLTQEKCWLCGGFNVHTESCKEQNYEWNKLEFGKHEGTHISKIPEGYLEWCQMKGIRSEGERRKWLLELQRRSNKYNNPKWEGFVSDRD